jgi:PAS domain S-box-containing protein
MSRRHLASAASKAFVRGLARSYLSSSATIGYNNSERCSSAGTTVALGKLPSRPGVRKFLDSLADLLDGKTSSLDTEGQFTSANKAVFQDSGFTPDEFLKMKFDDMVAPGSVELALSAFKEVVGGRKGGQTQLEIISKAGGRLWVEVSSRRLMQDGVVIGIQSIGRNVTWRRRLEQELLRSQKMEAVGRRSGARLQQSPRRDHRL